MGRLKFNLEGGSVEVHQETVLQPDRTEIGANNRNVHVFPSLDCLQLHHDSVIHEEIQPMESDLDATINHRALDDPWSIASELRHSPATRTSFPKKATA